jgi:hypothetical protein
MDEIMAYVALFEFGSQKNGGNTPTDDCTPLICYSFSPERATQHQQRIHVMTKVKVFPGHNGSSVKLCVIALLQGEVLFKKVVFSIKKN